MGIGKSKYTPMPQDVRELHVAVMRNDILKVRMLVSAGTDVNYPWKSSESCSFKDGSTPLCEAVSLNHRSIVEELIKSGAYVNKPDSFGCTPLHKSSYHGREKLTSILIEAGADIQVCDHDLNTPLQICAQNSIVHNNIDTIKLLIQAGANVNAPNQFGRIPLHYAAMWGLEEITDVLVKADSYLDYTDANGETPLYCCIDDIPQRFISWTQYDCRLNGINSGARETFQRHLPVIKILIQAGCDPLNLASWLHKQKFAHRLCCMDEELYNWYCESQPESLKQLCRQAIQNQFQAVSVANFKKLPLPLPLLEYVIRKLF